MAYDFNSKSGGSEGTWADNSGGSAGAWADSSDRGSYPDPAPVRQHDSLAPGRGGGWIQPDPERDRSLNTRDNTRGSDLQSWGPRSNTRWEPDLGPRSAPRPPLHIRWDIILILAAIAIAVTLAVVYRNEITMFLSQVLSWVISLVIIIVVVGLLFRSLFPRRW